MKVEIVEVKEDEKEILLNLIEKNLYEFSQWEKTDVNIVESALQSFFLNLLTKEKYYSKGQHEAAQTVWQRTMLQEILVMQKPTL